MFLGREYYRHPHGLPDLVLYATLVEDGVLRLWDDSLLATWTYEGHDLDSVTPAEAMSRAHGVSGVLNLGSGWMVETDACRRAVDDYLPPHPLDVHPIAALLETERREQFRTPDWHFRSQYFITLTYLPASQRSQKLESWIAGDKKAADEKAKRERLAYKRLQTFKKVTQEFEDGFSRAFQTRRLKREGDDDKLLRFLRECLFTDDHPFAPAAIPAYLNTRFAGHFVGGERPRLNDREIRVIAVDSYPVGTPEDSESGGSYPGVLYALENMPFAYRWHTRSLLLDPPVSEKLHLKHYKEWRDAKFGLFKRMTGFGSSLPNQNAADMERDALQAMTVAGCGLVQFGQYQSKIILQDANLERLGQHVRDVQKCIRPQGFGVRVETINAVDAWRGTWPGHSWSDFRRVPIHTRNFADMMPQGTLYTGRATNPSPHMKGAPPLLRCMTDGQTPYDFHLHAGEVPHVLMTGPNRTGKSAALAFFGMQWMLRFPSARFFAFDIGGSIKHTIQALGGNYYSFGGPGPQLQVCPLGELDTPEDQAWACQYLTALAELNQCRMTPIRQAVVSEAVQQLANGRRRSLTDFVSALFSAPSLGGDKELPIAFEFYTVKNLASGGILDGEEDGLKLGAPRQGTLFGGSFACGFELQHLKAMDKRILQAMLPYLMRAILRRLDTRCPTYVSMDEVWSALEEQCMRDFMRLFLKTGAKYNAGMLLAAQDMADLMKSALKECIVNQCSTRIYLPSPAAASTERSYYEELGLNDQQIQQIAEGTAKRDYFHHVLQPPDNHFRRLQLNLGKAALAFVGSNSSEDRETIQRLQLAYPRNWQAHWLRHKKLEDWADQYEELLSQEAVCCA
jgi:type IV secretion system protein VirB4